MEEATPVSEIRAHKHLADHSRRRENRTIEKPFSKKN